MAEIELFPIENSFDTTDPPASPAAVQGTSAPQDIIIEPAAATRGRRPSRVAPAHTSRRRGTPSPSSSRHQPPSPASSYTSAVSYAAAAENWTIAGLRQVLTSSGVIIPRRSTKPDLLALYASLQSREPSNSSPPSKAVTKASQGRGVPYARPQTNHHSLGDGPPAARPYQKAFSKPGSHPGCRSHQPPPTFSSHRARASNPSRRRAGLRLHKPPCQSKHTSVSGEEPPKAPAPPLSQSLPYPWPAAPPHTYSASMPPQSVLTPAPAIPPLFPPLFSAHRAYPSASMPPLTTAQAPAPAIPPLPPPPFSAHRAYPSASMPPLTTAQAPTPTIPPLFPSLSSAHRAYPSASTQPLTAQAPTPTIPPLFPSLYSAPQDFPNTSMQPLPAPAVTFPPPSARGPFSLSSATPLPIPPNALALEPAPVANSIRTQILSGTDVDLFSLLSPISPPSADRQIDCGEFSVTLKNSANNPSRILSFTEFTIAFNRYTEVICTEFSHRRRDSRRTRIIIRRLPLLHVPQIICS